MLFGRVEREAHSLRFSDQEAIHEKLGLATHVEWAYRPRLEATECRYGIFPTGTSAGREGDCTHSRGATRNL